MNSEPKDKAKPAPGAESEADGLRLPHFPPLSGAAGPNSHLSPAKPAELSSAEWLGLLEKGISPALSPLRFGTESESEKTRAADSSADRSSQSHTNEQKPAAKPPHREHEPALPSRLEPAAPPIASEPVSTAEKPHPAKPTVTEPAVAAPEPEKKVEPQPAAKPPLIEVHVVPPRHGPDLSTPRKPPAPQRPLALYTGPKVPFLSLASDAAGRPAVVLALPGRVVAAGSAWSHTSAGVRRLTTGIVGGLMALLAAWLVWQFYPVERTLSVPIEIVTARAPMEPVLREHRLALLSDDFAAALKSGAAAGSSRGRAAQGLWQALREQKAYDGCPLALLDRTSPIPAVVLHLGGQNPASAEPAARALAELYQRWQNGLRQGGLASGQEVEDRQNQRRQLQLELNKLQVCQSQAAGKLAEAAQALKDATEQRTILEKTRDTLAADYGTARGAFDKLLGGKGQIDFSPSAAELAAAKRDEPAFPRVEMQLEAARREHRRLLREAMDSAADTAQSLRGNLQEFAAALAASNSPDLPADMQLALQKISEEELNWQLALYRLTAAWQTLLGQMRPGGPLEADQEGVIAVQNAAIQAVDQYAFQTEENVRALDENLHALASAGTDMALRMALAGKLASQFNRAKMTADQLKDALAFAQPQGGGSRVNLPLQSAVAREQTALREHANLEKALKATLTAKAQGDFERDREGQLRKAKAVADRTYNRLEQVQGELAKLQDQQADLSAKEIALKSEKSVLETDRRQLADRLALLDQLIARLSQGATLAADQVDIAPTQDQVNAGAETARGVGMCIAAILVFGLGVWLTVAWGRLADRMSRGAG